MHLMTAAFIPLRRPALELMDPSMRDAGKLGEGRTFV